VKSKLWLTGALLLALLNTWLFVPAGEDLHDPAVVIGTLVAGIGTQAVVAGIVYGLYRLVRRTDPALTFPMVAFRTLLTLTLLKFFTILNPGRTGRS
jgi:hypothetical protein